MSIQSKRTTAVPILSAIVTKRKNVRGRIIGYRATCMQIERATTRLDAAEAIEQCGHAVTEILANVQRGTYIGQWRNHYYVLMPDGYGYGWNYWIDVFGALDYHVGPEPTRDEAEDKALNHLVTSIWDHEQDDQAFTAGLPEHVRKQCLDYFRWQREYRRLAARGLDDTRVRNILGGFAKEPADGGLCA